MANRIQLRRDTASNWTRVNPILEDGEPGLEINTNKVKYGDGNTRWNALPYASASSTYGDADVETYLVSNPPTGTYSNANVASYLVANPQGSTYSNANVASYLVANPQAGTYSNANVASYLPTYSGNIAGNIVKNGRTWTFGTDGSLTLPSGAGFGLGDSGQLKTNDGTTVALDFRDTSGRGFYTNGDGYTLRSDGSNNWIFGTNGTLSTPGNVRVGSAGTYGNISFVDTITANAYVVGTGTVIGNLTVGNLTVTGNSSIINTESYVVEDNIIQMANANPADTLDLGFIAHRTVGSTLEHTGLIRDASINKWALFSNVIAQPGATVDFTNAVLDDLLVGTVQGTDFTFANGVSILSTIIIPETYSNTNVSAYLSSSTLKTVANLAVSGSAPSSVTGSAGDTIGMIRVDSNYVYYCTNTFVPSSYTVGWEGASGNTLFLTKGDYPTPQVGWTVTYQSFGPYTIQTVTDESNWRITFDGALGSPGGGTATLTNPNPASIWKSVPLSAFQTAANATTRLTNGGSEVALQANGVTTFGNTATISNNGEFRIWANNDITVYRNGQDGYAVKSGSIENYTDNTQRTVVNSNGLEIKTGNLIIPNNKAVVFANGVNILSTVGGSSYGNTQVAAYLPTYSGNIGAGNIVTTGATSGNISGANVISANTVTVTTAVRTVPVTFANLPTAASAGAGARAFITDANTTTFASAVTGSGANSVPVYSNGTNWFVG